MRHSLQIKKATSVAAAVVIAGAACIATVSTTDAAFTDHAAVNLGTGSAGSGLGNPTKFDIAIRDAGNVLQDAATPASAVVLPTTGGTQFSEDTAVVFTAQAANRNPGITGDVSVKVWDPDPVSNDLYDTLRFTVTLDGAGSPVLTNATASDVNAANLTFTNVAPGAQHSVRLSVVIAAGAGITVAGKATALGLQFNGVSR
ncbi:hypothetical protein AB4Y88_00080 [Paenarthrobacter sp. RAF9]